MRISRCLLGMVCLLLLTQTARSQATWTSIPLGTTQTLTEIEYFDNQGIAVVGHQGFIGWKPNLATTWQAFQIPGSADVVAAERLTFTSSAAVSRNYFLGRDGQAWRFLPGENTLVSDTLPGQPHLPALVNGLTNLHISTLNESRYGITGNQGLVIQYKTGIDTSKIRNQLSTLKPISHLYAYNSWSVLAVGDSGKIWKTTSIALPYVPVSQLYTTQKLNRIFGKRDSVLWIAGNGGTLLKSTNSGNSWSPVPVPTTLNLNAGFIKGSVIWLCGDLGLILLSTDGGESWQTEITNTTADLLDIKPIGTSIYAVGKNGTLLMINTILPKAAPEKTPGLRLLRNERDLLIFPENGEISNLHLYNTLGQKLSGLAAGNGGFCRFSGLLPGLYWIVEEQNGRPTTAIRYLHTDF